MKKINILVLIIIAVAIGVIIGMTQEYTQYETFGTAVSNSGEQFHVIGELAKEEDMHYDPKEDPNYFSFFMIDKAGEERKVVFNGAKPRDFERSEEIVLTGKMDGDEFHASKILMKCPSKYIDDELEVTEVKAVDS